MKYEIVEQTMASGKKVYVAYYLYGDCPTDRGIIADENGCESFGYIADAKSAIEFHKDGCLVSRKTVYKEP